MLWRERGIWRNMGDGFSGNWIKSENFYNKKKMSIDKRNEGVCEGYLNGYLDYLVVGRMIVFFVLI